MSPHPLFITQMAKAKLAKVMKLLSLSASHGACRRSRPSPPPLSIVHSPDWSGDSARSKRKLHNDQDRLLLHFLHIHITPVALLQSELERQMSECENERETRQFLLIIFLALSNQLANKIRIYSVSFITHPPL